MGGSYVGAMALLSTPAAWLMMMMTGLYADDLSDPATLLITGLRAAVDGGTHKCMDTPACGAMWWVYSGVFNIRELIFRGGAFGNARPAKL